MFLRTKSPLGRVLFKHTLAGWNIERSFRRSAKFYRIQNYGGENGKSYRLCSTSAFSYPIRIRFRNTSADSNAYQPLQEYFPEDFKGKIIHVTRDPRAVAVSAYPFLGAMDHWKNYYELWNFKNADDFARHDVEGTFF